MKYENNGRSISLYFVDKPKLGIYIWAHRTDWVRGFFGIQLGFGTYNRLNIELLGLEATFCIAVGDWHTKYDKRPSTNSTQEEIDRVVNNVQVRT